MILTLSISVITFMTVINPSALTRQNRDTAQKAAVLRGAIQSYQFSHGGVSGSYPGNLDALAVDDSTGACTMDNTPTSTTYLLLQGWCGPYADRVFSQNSNDFKTDGWGTSFSFNSGTGVLTSYGPDKASGGGDDLVFNP